MSTDDYVRANMALARWQVQRTLNIDQTHPDYEDALQHALIAMARAFDQYDPTRTGQDGKVAKVGSVAAFFMQRELQRWSATNARRGFRGVSKRIEDGGWSPPAPLGLLDPIPGMGKLRICDEVSDWRRSDLETTDAADTVWWAMSKLRNPRSRTVLACRYWYGWTVNQTARALRMSVYVVRKVEDAALEELRKIMSTQP